MTQLSAPGHDRELVVVTGGASGLGRGIAHHFHAAGARVVIADIAGDRVDSVAHEIGVESLVVDIADSRSVDTAISTIEERYGRVDTLVNNAGLPAGTGQLVELDIDTFDACVRVNLRGTFLMTRAVGAHMARNGVGGAIVNVSSVGARQPTPGLGHYEATKAAVDALTRSAAVELAASGIRVNAVAPGPVATPMTAGLTADDAARAAWEGRIPRGTIAEVTDVAPTVVFLASRHARHITGVSLPIDGGQLLT